MHISAPVRSGFSGQPRFAGAPLSLKPPEVVPSNARPVAVPAVSAMRPASLALLFAGQQFKLMSYNAENLTPAFANIVTPETTAAKASVVLQEDPDVVAFQEVGDREYMQSFNKVLLKNRYHNVVGSPANNPNAIRVATLSKPQLQVTGQQSHWAEINRNDPYRGKRDFLEVDFQTRTGFQFSVFNGHFRSMNGGEVATLPIRMHEARVAARVVAEKLRQDPNYPLLVMGDLNSLHNTPHGQQVLDTLALKTDADPTNDLTEVFLKDGKEDPTHCMSDGYRKNKLDYVFASPGMLPLVKNAYVAGRFRKYPWKRASDHLPAVVVIEEPDKVASAKNAARPARPVAPPRPGQRFRANA